MQSTSKLPEQCLQIGEKNRAIIVCTQIRARSGPAIKEVHTRQTAARKAEAGLFDRERDIMVHDGGFVAERTCTDRLNFVMCLGADPASSLRGMGLVGDEERLVMAGGQLGTAPYPNGEGPDPVTPHPTNLAESKLRRLTTDYSFCCTSSPRSQGEEDSVDWKAVGGCNNDSKCHCCRCSRLVAAAVQPGDGLRNLLCR